MGKYKINLTVYFLIVCQWTLVSCSLLPKKINHLSVVKLKAPIFIHLKGIQGFEETSGLYSKSVVSDIVEDKKVEKEVKFAKFQLKTETLLVDRGQAHIHFLLKTLARKGNMDLNDLAVPELGEELRVTMYPNAEVVNVEGKAKTSIFYVPPISLPLHKVKVGDTWQLKRIWLTKETKIPVLINMTTEFKNYIRCGKNKMCADLELNGYINLPTADPDKIKLESQIRGRILFAIDSGNILWSHVRSREVISASGSAQVIESCTKAALIAPVDEALFSEPISCDPTQSESLLWPLSS